MPPAPTPLPTARVILRLIEAIEDLGRTESVALTTGNGHDFLEIQHRTAPLVVRLVSLVKTAGADLDESLRSRGLALAHAQRQRLDQWREQLQTVRGELRALDQARVRARALRPAYVQRSASSVFHGQA